MKQVIVKQLRLALLAFCALMALPSAFAGDNFPVGKTFYVQIPDRFTDDNCRLVVDFWNGTTSDCTLVDGTIYTFTTIADKSGLTLKRYNKNNEQQAYANVKDYTTGQTEDLIILSGTSDSMSYTWSTYSPAVSSPVISCENNNVTITCATDGATIYYSIDGSDPTTEYTGSFKITQDCTVKAIAKKDGLTDSSVTSTNVSHTAVFQVGKTYYIKATLTWFWNASTVPQVSGCFDSATDATEIVAQSLYYFVPTKEASQITIKRHWTSSDGSSDVSNTFTVNAPTDDSLNLITITQEGANNSWSTYEAQQIDAPSISCTNNLITITCPSGATLHYTIGGVEATATADVTYTMTSADTDLAVSAYATKAGYLDSDVVSDTFSYSAPQPRIAYVRNDASWGNIYLWAWDYSTSSHPSIFTTEYNTERPDIRNYSSYSGTTKEGHTCEVYSGYIGNEHVYKIVFDSTVEGIKFGNNDKDSFDGHDLWDGKIFYTSKYADGKMYDLPGTWTATEPESCEVPIIGYKNGVVTITKSNEGDNFQVYYTIDGTDPSASSNLYSEPFSITEDCTVKAIVIDSNNKFTNSEIVSKNVSAPNKVFYVQKDVWTNIYVWAWGDNGNVFSVTYDNQPDIANFKSSTVNTGRTFTVTEGYIGETSNVVYKVEVDSKCTTIRFAKNTKWEYTDFNGKLYKLSSNNIEETYYSEGWTAKKELANLDDNYYLLGDLNKWLNDGTYSNNGSDYSYGYVPSKHGIATDYQFTKVEDNSALPVKIQDSYSGNTWYKLDVKKSALNGKLYGQFTIYKGEFETKQTADDTPVTYYKPTWNDGREQWAWTKKQQAAVLEDITNNGLAYETFAEVLNGNEENTEDGRINQNICLAHNYVQNATLYFSPDAGSIFLTAENEKDAVDLYIYYARMNFTDEETAKSAQPTLSVNMASMNTVNYNLPSAPANHPMDLKSGEKTINNKTYNYWYETRIQPGYECPAGQYITVAINAEDWSDEFVTIMGDNVYLTDYIYLFLEGNGMVINDTTVEIENVEARVYGYSVDGYTMQVWGKNGTVVGATANDDNCWSTLNRGNLDTDKIDINKLTFDEAAWSDAETGTGWSTFSNDDDNSFHISAANATKFIQYRITYKAVASQGSRRREAAASETVLIPTEFLTYEPTVEEYTTAVENNTQEYMYYLNGEHKIVNLSGIETGIEEILDEEATDLVEGAVSAPVYYNLQGQRVNNPEHGIYIRVCGNKADKVIY